MKRAITLLLSLLLVGSMMSFAHAEADNKVPTDIIIDAAAKEITVSDPNDQLAYNAADRYFIANGTDVTIRFTLPEGSDIEHCYLQNANSWYEPVYVSTLPVEDGHYVYAAHLSSLEDPEMSFACTDIQFYIDQEYDPDTHWPNYIINFYVDEANLEAWIADFDGASWEYLEAPADPTDAPVDPTDAPVDPTDAPADTTDAPVDPSDAPADTTDAPADPTDAPADTTDAPADPSDAPADTPEAPETGALSLAGLGIAAALTGSGIVLFKKKED